MTAQEALVRAREAGISVEVRGSNLVLRARSRPPAEVIEWIRIEKASLIAALARPESATKGILGPSAPRLSHQATPPIANEAAEDWIGFFEERAAIAEFDGGLARDRAEVAAFKSCVVMWLHRHPPTASSADCCLWCGRQAQPGRAIVPFGVRPEATAWLHPTCWESWHRARISRAETELAAHGIRRPSLDGVDG